jgi:hypothetical protein
MRPVDHPEDVLVAVELVAREPERHGPDAADAQIALGLDEASWRRCSSRRVRRSGRRWSARTVAVTCARTSISS